MATPVLASDQTTATNVSTALGTSGTVSFSHDSGTDGSNRCIVIRVTTNGSITIGTVTYNGVTAATPTSGSATSSGRESRFLVLANPATGSNTVAIPYSAGGSGGTMLTTVTTYKDVDQTTPMTGMASAATFGAPTVNVTSTAATDLVLDNCFNFVDSTGTAGANQTETSDQNSGGAAAVGSQFTSQEDGNGGTVTMSWTPSATNNYVTVAGRLQYAAPAGPTIDTQPVADVGLINGDASRRTTVYTVEASGDTFVGITWNEDGSPISNGGIYAISTSGVGTNTLTSTLTITRTDKTGTPFDINADVEDAAGTTATNTVTDTWYTGPVLSKSSGTTNGSGVDTLTCVSDYPNADGEFTVVEATAGDVTKTVSLHYEAP